MIEERVSTARFVKHIASEKKWRFGDMVYLIKATHYETPQKVLFVIDSGYLVIYYNNCNYN